jgi:hypothetical protein
MKASDFSRFLEYFGTKKSLGSTEVALLDLTFFG